MWRETCFEQYKNIKQTNKKKHVWYRQYRHSSDWWMGNECEREAKKNIFHAGSTNMILYAFDDFCLANNFIGKNKKGKKKAVFLEETLRWTSYSFLMTPWILVNLLHF